MADRAGLDLAGARVAADHRVPAAAAGGDDVVDPDDPADRVGGVGCGVALAGAFRTATLWLWVDFVGAGVSGCAPAGGAGRVNGDQTVSRMSSARPCCLARPLFA